MKCNMLVRVSNRKPCPVHGYIHSLLPRPTAAYQGESNSFPGYQDAMAANARPVKP